MISIVTNGNSKLGKNIGNINMPKGITCRHNAPCAIGCYCNRGHMILDRVKTAFERNYNLYKTDPKLFYSVLDIELRVSNYKFIRWHSSGDIIDSEYFNIMCKLASKHKKIKFLCFTKQYEIVNDYISNGNTIPRNLTVVFSSWKTFVPYNPYNLPTAWVYFNKEKSNNLIPSDARLCSKSCAECVLKRTNCWNLKSGNSVYFKKH